eukprot:4405339-Prymnesium_polylepis.1
MFGVERCSRAVRGELHSDRAHRDGHAAERNDGPGWQVERHRAVWRRGLDSTAQLGGGGYGGEAVGAWN